MRQYTVIYSSPSTEALEKLVDEIKYAFNIYDTDIDDMFYYGVFCNIGTYANFHDWGLIPDGVDVPEVLCCECNTEDVRYAYVKDLIDSILRGEIEKPEWMSYVEEEVCEEGFAPSTFLYIIPKDGKYDKLAESLVNFLYSPNMISTLLDC